LIPRFNDASSPAVFWGGGLEILYRFLGHTGSHMASSLNVSNVKEWVGTLRPFQEIYIIEGHVWVRFMTKWERLWKIEVGRSDL
jgi:hypothetical protein